MTNYYVYYRVDAARLATLRGEVEKLFSDIEKATGVRGRLMHCKDKPETYMEVYEGVADDVIFKNLLKQQTANFGIDRHMERFVCA